MSAYYNEIDPFAAEWLRHLIKAGHIADGVVDERSIEDITPNELKEFTQCHFFAGIGVWSHAIRQAGWPDDRPIWTGSCPCQPFSSAGKGKGTADERHLWPAFHHLIRECRPELVFGEQVANKAGESWFDLVSTDLEAEGYACGLSVFPACGIGAPHQRKRLYWVAHSCDIGAWSQPRETGDQGRRPVDTGAEGLRQSHGESGASGLDPRSTDGSVAHANNSECKARRSITSGSKADGDTWEGGSSRDCSFSSVANPNHKGLQGWSIGRDGPDERFVGANSLGNEQPSTGPTNLFWRDADWLGCRDGKWRPVEPGTFPLAHGSPARVGQLRGYGNAIVGPQAQAFIEAVCEALTEQDCF